MPAGWCPSTTQPATRAFWVLQPPPLDQTYHTKRNPNFLAPGNQPFAVAGLPSRGLAWNAGQSWKPFQAT